MPKETWTIASILTIALLLGLLTFSSYDKKIRLEQAQAEMAQIKEAASKSAASLQELRDKLSAAEEQIQQLEKDKQAAVQTRDSLENEMRSALESKDVTISKLQGKLTVNILDRVLFDSGEAELKPDGAAVLRKVAGFLSLHTNLQLHVVGHTDNVPIRAALKNRFASNWELSTARATAAVRFLTEKAGVDPRRLGVLGYGEYRPVADNSTPEGRAKNRRIAITVVSEDVLGVDAPTVLANAALETQGSTLDPVLSTTNAPVLPPGAQ